MSAKPEQVTNFARSLRRRSTPDESHLWRLLKDRRLAEFKFRRQVPVGRYFADFACYERRLIVELDGSQHAGSSRDKIRDAELARRGFSILRVWNNDLRLRRSMVLDAICVALEEGSPSPALRAPSPTRGEGRVGNMVPPTSFSPRGRRWLGAAETDEGAAT